MCSARFEKLVETKCIENQCNCRNKKIHRSCDRKRIARKLKKYQGVKEFHMLARVGCCNIMVFSPFKVKVTY